MKPLGRSLVSILCLLLLVSVQLSARADPVVGNATHFDGLGSPYGGCGMPQANLDSQDFVALNVYDTPGDYSYYPRPIPPAQADKTGLYDNGRNCGRFVEVAAKSAARAQGASHGG